MAKLGSIPEFVYCPGVMGGRVTEEGRRYRDEGTERVEARGREGFQEEGHGRRLTGQVPLIDLGHFVSKTDQLTGLQCPD